MPNFMEIPRYRIPGELQKILDGGIKEFPGISEIGKQYLDVLKNLDQTIEIPKDCHLEMLKVLLFTEQHKLEEDLKKQSIKGQFIQQSKGNFKIFKIMVPAIDEDNPFLFIGDTVILNAVGDEKYYRLSIIEVGNVFVRVKCARSTAWFHPYARYDIAFETQNYSLRCHHYALDMFHHFDLRNLLHPKRNAICMSVPPEKKRLFFNRNIQNNLEQKQAIEHIIAQTARPAPYILFGPPGTGKTATIVESIYQIWNCDQHDRILVCTPSNAAADEIAKRLLEIIPNNEILRMYSTSRDVKTIHEKILPCAKFIDGQGVVIPRDALVKMRIVITTLCTCMRLVWLRLSENHFSYIFIDEAGQATEPETLIPFGLMSSDKIVRKAKNYTQVVLSGDPKQLGAVVKSRFAMNLLGTSMLERLMKLDPYKRSVTDNKLNPSFITKLVKNFRSHDAILTVPNELFYENELIACGGDITKMGENWMHLKNRNIPIIFHAVDGPEFQEKGQTSTCNISEIDEVMMYVKKLTTGKTTFKQENIGIVTPFKLQEKEIKRRLHEGNHTNIDAGTVQIFQGQEKDVIILSTVRSRLLQNVDGTHIGFLSNKKRFNVSVTRAKALLIVVGNPNVLKTDPTWRQFLRYCKTHNACDGIDFSLADLTEAEKKSLCKPPMKLQSRRTFPIKEVPIYVRNNDYRASDESEDVCGAMRVSRELNSSSSSSSGISMSLSSDPLSDDGSEPSIDSSESASDTIEPSNDTSGVDITLEENERSALDAALSQLHVSDGPNSITDSPAEKDRFCWSF